MKRVLRQYLIDDATIAALIVTRCYSRPVDPADSARPYLVIRRINHRQPTGITVAAEFVFEEWMIECYADSDAEAEALMVAVRDRCQVPGPQVTTPYAINAMTVIETSDDSEPMVEGGDEQYYWRFVTVHINRATTLS
jgi:hypothetical protein